MSLRDGRDEHDIKYKQRGSKSTPNSPNHGVKAKTNGSNPYLNLFSIDPQDEFVEMTIDFLTISVDWDSSPSLTGSSGSCSLLFPEKLGHPKAKLESEFPLSVLAM